MNEPQLILIYGRPGRGKTTLVKALCKKLVFTSLHIITRSLDDDYTADEISQFGTLPENTSSTDQLDLEFLLRFREQAGRKVVILDDVLGISVFSKSDKHVLRDILSRARHYDMYIIVSVQLLKHLDICVRMCAQSYFTSELDLDSRSLIETICGTKKENLVNLILRNHKFLYCNTKGTIKIV